MKVGQFDIPNEIIDENPEVVRKIMGECVVVRAEAMFEIKGIRYTALVEAFEEIEPAVVPPFYDINIDDAGAITWAKRE